MTPERFAEIKRFAATATLYPPLKKIGDELIAEIEIQDAHIEGLRAEALSLRAIANAAAELIDAPDDADAWHRLNMLVKGITPAPDAEGQG